MGNEIDPKIHDFLVDFGLTEREITLYLCLLKTGPNTIMNLARETGIKRSTTHNNVEELIKKGLVSQTNFGERRMVVAEDPEKLKFLMEQKKYNVQKLETNLGEVVSGILSLVPEAKEKNQVEVKYYEGKDPTSTIYNDAFSSKELRAYVNLAVSHTYFPENAVNFAKLQKEGKAPMVKDIIDPSQETKVKASIYSKSPNFKYKISPQPLNLSAVNILLYSGKVAIVNYTNKITGTVIADKQYYDSSVSIFELMWSLIDDKK